MCLHNSAAVLRICCPRSQIKQQSWQTWNSSAIALKSGTDTPWWNNNGTDTIIPNLAKSAKLAKVFDMLFWPKTNVYCLCSEPDPHVLWYDKPVFVSTSPATQNRGTFFWPQNYSWKLCSVGKIRMLHIMVYTVLCTHMWEWNPFQVSKE